MGSEICTLTYYREEMIMKMKLLRKRRWLACMAGACLLLAAMLPGCAPQQETMAAGQSGDSPHVSEMESFSRSDLKQLVGASESTTLDSAVAPGESAALNGYVSMAGQSMTIRAKVLSYLDSEDLSQQLIKTLAYNQMAETPGAAVLMELETYDYPNPQLPYIEDMLEIELLSADGKTLGAMGRGAYECSGFEPLTAVQGQAAVPGWLIVEVGQDNPAFLKMITHDKSGQEHAAYMALPESDSAAAPDTGFAPAPAAVGDTLTDDGATLRILGVRTTDGVYTSAVGECYSAEGGAQLIDMLFEYEGPEEYNVLNTLAAALQNDRALRCETVLLELPDRKSFSRSFITEAGANRIHLVLPAAEEGTPVQILFSVNGTPYSMDYTIGEELPSPRPIKSKGTDTAEGSFKIVIDKIAYGKEVRSSVSNNKYRFHEAGKDNLLLVVTYQLENLSQSDLVLDQICGVYAAYDADTEAGTEAAVYAGQVTRRAGAGELDSSIPIAPGELSKVNYAFIEVPKEMKNRSGTIWLTVCDVRYDIPMPVK